MTKGHFHQIVDTAEVYYTLKGEGYMMLENLDGDWKVERMEKGKALYVPRGYAHRTINTGDEVLTAFYVFDANAGHDYGTIETKGYRHIVCLSCSHPCSSLLIFVKDLAFLNYSYYTSLCTYCQ